MQYVRSKTAKSLDFSCRKEILSLLSASKLTEFPKYSWMFLPRPCSQSDLHIKIMWPQCLKAWIIQKGSEKDSYGKRLWYTEELCVQQKNHEIFSETASAWHHSAQNPPGEIWAACQPSGADSGFPGRSSATLYLCLLSVKGCFKMKYQENLSLFLKCGMRKMTL